MNHPQTPHTHGAPAGAVPAPMPSPAGSPSRPRSPIPRVVGILAIVFSVIGLLMSGLVSIGAYAEVSRFAYDGPDFSSYSAWANAYMILAVALFGIHLTAGIGAVAYRRWAPRLMTIYGIFAIVLIIANIGVPLLLLNAVDTPAYMMDDLWLPRVGVEVMALPWPVIALVMMNLRGARESCAAT